MSARGSRPKIETAICLRLAVLLSARVSQRSNVIYNRWIWTRNGETLGTADFDAVFGRTRGYLDLRYQTRGRDVSSRILLKTTPQHFGGRRWWFVCPISRLLATKLYKFPDFEYFCHRTAVWPLPTYRTQRLGGLSRNHEQRRAIRRRLACGDLSIRDDLVKPKGMWRHTFRKFVDRDDALAAAEDRVLWG